MKSEDIYNGISRISPELLEEAESHGFPVRRKYSILKWTAAAAVLVLLCGVGVFGAAGGFTVKKVMANGYVISTDLSRIPMKEIGGSVNEASWIILDQFKNTTPYSSWYPGSYYKELKSPEEASDYVGLSQLQTPYFPYEDATVQIRVAGNRKGRIEQIIVAVENCTANVRVFNHATLYTEHYDGKVYEMENLYPQDISFTQGTFVTAAGLLCTAIESSPLDSGYKGITGYVVSGDVVYSCHTAFLSKDQAEAEKIIHDWAESIK